MPDDSVPPGVVAAGSLLRELLISRSMYRRRWQYYAQRMRSQEISYAGVSQVIALYLWECGLKPESDTELPRRLRDRVTRALKSEQLTYETLTWLIEAFMFDKNDSHAVWNAYSGNVKVDDLEDEGVSFTLHNPKVPIIKPQRHKTIALFTRYYISADRMLRRIETSHVMIALEDGVETYAYNPRDTLVDIVALVGGKVVGFHESAPGFVGVEFKLDRPLRKNQPTSLQYFSTYHPTCESIAEVRRAARKRIENIDIQVHFEGESPKRAWWSVWDDHSNGSPLRSEEVEMDSGAELHRFVPYMEQAVAGFRWEW